MSNTNRRTRQAGSVSMALLLSLLTGCEALPKLRPLPSSVLTGAGAGNNSIILARVDCRTPLPPNSMGVSIYTGQLPGVFTVELVLGDAASSGLPKWVDSRKDFIVLSSQPLTEGWIMMIKPPGYYYLYMTGLVQGAGRNFSKVAPGGRYRHDPIGFDILIDPQNGIADSRMAPRELVMSIYDLAEPRKPNFRIEVPPGKPLIYAGTFHVDCPSPVAVFNADVESATAVVEDQSEAAAAVARREFPSLPPPVTRLAVQHSGPILLGVPAP